MFPAMTVGKQIAIGYAIALMFLLVTGLAAVRGTAALVATSEHVARSHEVLTAANELMATLVDAESGQRGFVVTGAEEFLDPYHEGVAAVRTLFERLRTLTRDDPRHHERLARAWPLIQAKIARNAETVEARRKGGFAAGQRLVASAVGKRHMDGIRAAIDELMVEERGRLERRAEEAAAVAASTARMSLAATLLALLSVALSGLLITRALARRIDTGVQGLRSSSFELQAVANQQATAAGQQATSMNEIAATMREVIASSRQIAAGAQHVAHIAAETADAARAGTRAVGAAKEAMGTIQRHVDAVVGHMLDLGRKTQQIGAVVDITLELADQANIVAINATIEAAGAGEQGRRFAAVADELRKLADRVAASTKEIGPLVAEVRAAADTTVMATEGGAKAVDAGTHQFLELATAFDQIVRQVAATDEAAREIELSTHQQTTAVEQVHLAIGDAARAARETEASSQQTLQTATQLTSLSRELHALTRPATPHA